MENNKPPDEVAQAVIKAFWLNRLSADEVTGIDTMWIIEAPLYIGTDIYIAGVNQIKWNRTYDAVTNIYKGLLLASERKTFDFIGADPYRVIDLEWPDEMAKGLQSLNMLPYYASFNQFDGTSADYVVHTYWSGGGEGHAVYRHITSNRPEIKGFLDTIIHTIESMAAIYNDEEINQLIKRGRGGWPYRFPNEK